jgi:beta-phosphoglucomutase
VIKAIIFDLDGVIVDTAHYHFVAWQRLAKELGVNFSLEDNERLKGVSRIRSLEIILEIGGITLPKEKMEEFAVLKNKWFLEYVSAIKPEEIFPKVKELIIEMKKQGYKIALGSSSKNAELVLELLKIKHLFDAIADGNMITKSKPNPEIFLLAASKLGVSPSECVVFEDAVAGVEAALAAGMKCVGIGSAEQLGKANLIIAKTGDFKIEQLHNIEAEIVNH